MQAYNILHTTKQSVLNCRFPSNSIPPHSRVSSSTSRPHTTPCSRTSHHRPRRHRPSFDPTAKPATPIHAIMWLTANTITPTVAVGTKTASTILIATRVTYTFWKWNVGSDLVPRTGLCVELATAELRGTFQWIINSCPLPNKLKRKINIRNS